MVSTAARPPAGLGVQRQPCPQGASLEAGAVGEREAGPGGRAGGRRPCSGGGSCSARLLPTQVALLTSARLYCLQFKVTLEGDSDQKCPGL